MYCCETSTEHNFIKFWRPIILDNHCMCGNVCHLTSLPLKNSYGKNIIVKTGPVYERHSATDFNTFCDITIFDRPKNITSHDGEYKLTHLRECIYVNSQGYEYLLSQKKYEYAGTTTATRGDKIYIKVRQVKEKTDKFKTWNLSSSDDDVNEYTDYKYKSVATKDEVPTYIYYKFTYKGIQCGCIKCNETAFANSFAEMLNNMTLATCLYCGHTCHSYNNKCDHIGVKIYSMSEVSCPCSTCKCVQCINDVIGESATCCLGCVNKKEAQINNIYDYISNKKTGSPIFFINGSKSNANAKLLLKRRLKLLLK